MLVDEQHPQRLSRGTARRHGIRVGDDAPAGAARVYGDDAIPGLPGMVRFEWDALDAWFEEDEQVFVHPRNPVHPGGCDPLDPHGPRRTGRGRAGRVVFAGHGLRDRAADPVLPQPQRVELRSPDPHRHGPPARTRARTSGYWSVRVGETVHADLAWAYDFPTRQLLPIAGLVAFYNEKVDIYLDGDLLRTTDNTFLQVARRLAGGPVRPERAPRRTPPWSPGLPGSMQALTINGHFGRTQGRRHG